MIINPNIPFDEALIKLSLKLSDNELKNIGNINSVRDYYTRLRRMNQNPIIKHRDDILDMYKYTYDGDLFLQDDTGKENEGRIIIFYRKTTLELISRSDVILCDATFKSAPRDFHNFLSYM
ncbi:hypothetical protein DMUE_3262 [Dictyocoela muelleri]|nr:hypothetical protein DMUE_3262 [Dictyocoela muelleri]